MHIFHFLCRIECFSNFHKVPLDSIGEIFPKWGCYVRHTRKISIGASNSDSIFGITCLRLGDSRVLCAVWGVPIGSNWSISSSTTWDLIGRLRQFVNSSQHVVCTYVLCTRLDIGNSLTRIFDCADILLALLTPLFSVVAMTRDHTSLPSVVAQHYPRNSHGWLAGVFGISLKLFHWKCWHLGWIRICFIHQRTKEMTQSVPQFVTTRLQMKTCANIRMITK